MRHRARITRRKFLQVAATAAAAGPLAACVRGSSPWRFLTVQEAQTLEAICERIIPADQDPGAAWAGVVNYLDLQLVGPFKRHQNTYRKGIAAVDETSRQKFGRAFVMLAAADQDKVLQAFEKGQAAGATKGSSQRFFAMVVDHTMQGFYGDPRHGGNRERVSWKMLGLPYPPVRGQLHYDLTKLPKV